jgi:hypothetical protein
MRHPRISTDDEEFLARCEDMDVMVRDTLS